MLPAEHKEMENPTNFRPFCYRNWGMKLREDKVELLAGGIQIHGTVTVKGPKYDCNCLGNVGPSTSHSPMGLHGLVQG
jgi:hypothetical protein